MRALDLFCGACGGWSLGMHRAGYTTAAACEIDPWRRAVFSRNFPNVRMYDDVRSLTADRLRRDLGRDPEVIVGSPPCQDASSANHKGKGVDGERTGLFFEAIRLVDECRPVWFAFENVVGLRTRGLERLLSLLADIGYRIWPFDIPAAAAGAPHVRGRLWMVGVRTDVADADQEGCERPVVEGFSLRLVEKTPFTQLGNRVVPCGREWERGPDLRLGDGIPRRLVGRRVAAYGDAVVPQITEAIGRAMMRLLPARAA